MKLSPNQQTDAQGHPVIYGIDGKPFQTDCDFWAAQGLGKCPCGTSFQRFDSLTFRYPMKKHFVEKEKAVTGPTTRLQNGNGTCSKCGDVLPSGAKFCINCAAPVQN